MESQRLRGEAEAELVYLGLAEADETLYRQNLLNKFEEMPMAPAMNAFSGMSINRGVAADDGWGW